VAEGKCGGVASGVAGAKGIMRSPAVDDHLGWLANPSVGATVPLPPERSERFGALEIGAFQLPSRTN